MAKGSNDKLSFTSIVSDIRAGRFAPVYILYGTEPYYLDRITDLLERRVVDEADRDFNQYVYFGNETDIDVIAGTCKQFPVMSPRQLVVLKEAQSMYMAKNSLDKLAPYIERPNKTTVLAIVFKGDKINATSEIIKAAKKTDAVVFESNLIKENYLPGHVKDYCASKRIGIEDKAVMLLCEYVGNPLDKLFSEIDKLCVVCSEKGRIDCDDIEANIGISKDFNGFELKSALANKDYVKAVRIVRYFSQNPKAEPTVKIIGLLYQYFSALTEAAFLSDKSDSNIMNALEISSYALRDIKTGLKNYNAAQCVKAIKFLREFDCKSKGIGSFSNEFDLMMEYVFNTITQ